MIGSFEGCTFLCRLVLRVLQLSDALSSSSVISSAGLFDPIYAVIRVMVTHIFLSSNLALPPVLCRLVIFNGPSPSDRLDDYKNKCTT